MIVFSVLNLIIFMLIALLHIYWALGGTWGIMQAIPQQNPGEPAFKPGPIATLLVAIGLLGFAFVHVLALGIGPLIAPKLVKIALAIIAGIFLLRAIGDYKYVGLFKKVKTGSFAKNDSKYYTPLCLLIVLNALITYSMV
ncbi:DUF3995 domain-containing protein [Aureispira anguillae]|uniref:DUF3995 domain-containing protein n=1 Tax=Aureispira anguillae TaxID=2864201 RepID=A0A915YLZ7_9BACT|nr:DUF3995 domain-containing protein [Aureispira anguillae]BDS15391.1 DUF3995 domain-containing protein [Aureispira anguillae]